MAIDVLPYIERLMAHVEARDYAGYDPYDALNSPVVRALSFGAKWPRIAWTQLLRRCPVNFRPFLALRKGHNPKAVGLFLGAYARLAGRQAGSVQTRITHLLDLLTELRSSGYSGNCWGYNFDWQSRAAFVPRGTPTLVNTAFIGHALLDAHRTTGSEAALELARTIPRFMLNDLNRKSDSDAYCFSYTPVDHNYVHNANLLGASLLIRMSREFNDASLAEEAVKALRYSLRRQRDDGSWPYAETRLQGWVDSFHTGFNLGAISHFMDAGRADLCEAVFRRGVEFYAANFFRADGSPKYCHNRIYPLDIHCAAVAVSFFSGMGQEYRELTDRILSWMLTNMWNERSGCFHYRKGRWLTNRIPYMRWNQAWAFHALAEYYAQTADAPKREN